MAARCSSTRSARCRSTCRPSCCASLQTGTFQPVGGSQPRQVDVRFVCATNRDPRREVEAGRLPRGPLLPAARHPDRSCRRCASASGDALEIAQHFLPSLSPREERKRFRGFAPEVEAAILQSHPWPGNVRQLQNVVRNVVVMHDGAAGGGDAAAPLLRATPRPGRGAAGGCRPPAAPAGHRRPELPSPPAPHAGAARHAWAPPPEPQPAVSRSSRSGGWRSG